MGEPLRLSELVSVRGRYLRSVHLERDYPDTHGNGYHWTECALRALAAVSEALERPAARALTVLGPYGAGKSAFCVNLARLLAGTHPPSGRVTTPPPGWVPRGSRLLPVLLVGSRQPLAPALLQALASALERNGYRRLLDRITSDGQWPSGDPSPRQVADTYRRAAELSSDAGADGVLLIIDEMGKFLEYAALHPSTGDLFALQEMAEAASRSGDHPLILLTVLHQSAEAYAQKLGQLHQAEWAKIAERFSQIAFFPSDLERIDLAGRALQHAPELRLNGALEQLSESCEGLGLGQAGPRGHLRSLAKAAYPLHPVTLLALPALFRKTGQSHRSLFGFLSGDEPFALGRFLRETPFNESAPPLYPPDALFSYAADVLQAGWSGSGIARQWAEAVESIDRACDCSATAQRLLRCIALLGILRDPRLPASAEVLGLSLTGCDGAAPPLGPALEELLRHRLIAYSRVREAYRLCDGGDVDVEEELSRTRLGLPAGSTLHVAQELCPPSGWIARRHSYVTGTVRSVTARPCAASTIEAALAKGEGSLEVLLCLATNPGEVGQALGALQRIKKPNVAAVVAVESPVLREAAQDVAAAHLVQQNTPALQGDRASRRELDVRRREAEGIFRSEWDRLLGPGSSDATWIYRGEQLSVGSARAFSELLSRMADETYPAAPHLRNELLNRRSLSSAAAAGRRALIEAMLLHGTKPRLGLSGYPPELSMYECVLRASGVHRELEGGQWWFVPPEPTDPAHLAPVWSALERELFVDPPRLRAVADLFSVLNSPPYGITEGVFPVLLCAFLLANSHETTLYREGSFLPEPTVADWEVLLRRPELFSVAGCRVTGERLRVVERLARGLKTEPAVVPIVRSLIRMVKGLPEHAWRTRRLPSQVLALRTAIDRAQSPERLLFHDLPYALCLTETQEQSVTPWSVDAFFAALNRALHAWQEVTPATIQRALDRLQQACGYPAGQAGWAALRGRATQLEGKVTEPTLQSLVRRLVETHDEQSAKESVLGLVGQRPPGSWTDLDVDRFPSHADRVGQLWRQADQALRRDASASLTSEEETRKREVAADLRSRLDLTLPPHVLRAALLELAEELAPAWTTGSKHVE